MNPWAGSLLEVGPELSCGEEPAKQLWLNPILGGPVSCPDDGFVLLTKRHWKRTGVEPGVWCGDFAQANSSESQS